MLRLYTYALAVGIITQTAAQSAGTLEELIAEIFETTEDENDHRVIGGERCEAIHGALQGDCFDCHACESPILEGDAGMQRLQLQTESCVRRGELCCVPVTPDLRQRNSERCGVSERGAAEHPWSAALYRRMESGWERACSALAIGSRALLTTARCAVSASIRDLRVRLHDNSTLLSLQHVAPNFNYSALGRYDAAVLVMEDAGVELQAACLPTEPPRPGQVCLTLQDSQPPVYSRVMSQDTCERVLHSGGVVLHHTQLCSIIDLAPAQFYHAAPLLCQDPDGWTVSGLASYRGLLTDGLHLHTRVDALSTWLRDQMRAWDAV